MSSTSNLFDIQSIRNSLEHHWRYFCGLWRKMRKITKLSIINALKRFPTSVQVKTSTFSCSFSYMCPIILTILLYCHSYFLLYRRTPDGSSLWWLLCFQTGKKHCFDSEHKTWPQVRPLFLSVGRLKTSESMLFPKLYELFISLTQARNGWDVYVRREFVDWEVGLKDANHI